MRLLWYNLLNWIDLDQKLNNLKYKIDCSRRNLTGYNLLNWNDLEQKLRNSKYKMK